MPTSTTFQGKTLIQPQVVSSIDDTALQANNIAGSATVGIVGVSTGGKPNDAATMTFTNANDAANTLRSGALLDCVRKAFDPGAGVNGAPKVVAIRVGAPTQSSLTLQDSAPANTIVLTSRDYGAWTTQIRVAVATGTNRGKKLTVTAPDRLGNSGSLIADDVYRAAMSLSYNNPPGTGSAATVTVTSTQISTSVTTTPADGKTFTFAAYPTLQQIVDAYNATGVYTAAVLSNPSDASTTLDGQTAQVIYNTTFTLTATLQASVDYFNTTPFVTAVRSTGILPPANLSTTYLTSGSDGSAASNSDYSAGLVVLESVDTALVCVATGTAAVHAFVGTHVLNMSGVTGKKERIGIVGGVSAETVAQAQVRAANLGAQRLGLVYPGYRDANPDTGVLTLYDPFYAAAGVAGILAGAPVIEAATNKAIGATSLESNLSDANLDALLSSGVIPLRVRPQGGFRITQSISTWTADSNFAHVELSVRRNADTVIRSVRDNLVDLVGKASGPSLAFLIVSRVNSVLRQAEFDGLIVGTPTSPAFKNVQVSLQGAVAAVQFTASVGVPANYITLTAHVQGFAATA